MQRFFILLAGILLGVLPACKKTIVNPQSFPAHPAPTPDTLHDLRHLTDSLPDIDQFLLALHRTGYDTLLRQTGQLYTLLIPTDSLLNAAGGCGFTVSTLHEAEYLAAAGFDDIMYAVPATAGRVPRAAALIRAGCKLSLLVDSAAAARQLASAAEDEDVDDDVVGDDEHGDQRG